MQKQIQKYLKLAKKHLLLPQPALNLPLPRLALPEPIKKLLGWPIIPWLILVGILLALLLVPWGCAKKIVIAPQFSNLVPGYYGEFKLLANSQPVGSELLAAAKMSDGKVLIVYRHPAAISSALAIDYRNQAYDDVKSGIIPVVFDPATNSFSQLRDAIPFDNYNRQRGGFSWLLLNDRTFVIAGGSSYDPVNNRENYVGGGTIFDLVSGEKTSFTGGGSSSGPFLARLSDNEFVVAETKVRPREGQEWVGEIYEAWLRVYNASGTELRSAQVSPYQLVSNYPGGAGTASAFTYDAGDKLLITLSGRLDILDKQSLALTPVSNNIDLEGSNGAQIDVLDNGLLLIHNRPQHLKSYLSDTVYLLNPKNYQVAPINFARGLPIRKLAWQGIGTFTEEAVIEAVKIADKTPYRFSVLPDGTILAVPNNLEQINKHPYLIDINNYRLVEDIEPPEEIVELRNPLVANPRYAEFAADVVLNDGRVIYLGVQNVIYTPSEQQTPEQKTPAANRKELPDWPSTDFATQGVWEEVGNLLVTEAWKDRSLNIGGIVAVGNDMFIELVDDEVKVYGQLFDSLTGRTWLVDDTETNRQKYDTLLTSKADARYVAKDRYGTFQVGKPLLTRNTAPPQVIGSIIIPAPSTVSVGQKKIERYDAKTNKWVDINEEIFQKLVKRYEKQGKQVSSWDSDAISDLDKKIIEEAQKKAAGKPKNPDMVTVNKAEIGGRLLKARSGHSVTVLPNGKILVAGGIADLSDLPAMEPFDDQGRFITNYLLGTITLPGTKVTLGNITGSKQGKTRSVEIYDPKTQKSEEVGQLTIGRSGHQVVILPGDKALVIGGSEQSIIAKDASRSEEVGEDRFSPGTANSGPTYEIFDLDTGESELYENVLMFRRDKGFYAFAMPNGHIYLGDTGLYSNAEVLDWYNHISYPTGQPSLEDLGNTYSSVRLSDDRLVSTGGSGYEFRDETNRVIATVLDPTLIEVYTPTSKGPRILPRGAPYRALPLAEALRTFLYLQLTVLLLGMPLTYFLVDMRKRRKRLKR
ncbi:hypothetical protein A2V68_02525 [candidate division Kazan bacterium RBG_13_50_9]|uniref:Uncharacterized protein n=1 Tax=candidate division Kazan bacterium RBG_13_50_9 TaxID=1798535 RepID=A0A1F4NRN8_UNCK3|nr:MAG: hypothetical protein A2V68_02525 [candidate division Kazan bacterium RBG_13_50_9]